MSSRWWGRACRLLVLLAAWFSLCVYVWSFARTSRKPDGSDLTPSSALPQTVKSGVPDIAPLSSGDAVIQANLEKENPRLPLEFWAESKMNYTKYRKMNNCARVPTLWEVSFNNAHWQALSVPLKSTKSPVSPSPSSPDTSGGIGNFFLYSAYYDIRPLVKLRPVIRIFAMIDRINMTTNSIDLHCVIWFPKKTEPLIVPVMEFKYIWISKWGNFKNGILQPYMISCKVPNDYLDKLDLKGDANNGVPRAVSLVGNPCDTASNLLRVIYNTPPNPPFPPSGPSFRSPPSNRKLNFAVCVKGLDFPYTDLSYRLVEWLELLRLLGVDKVFMYKIHVHPRVAHVLQYYVDKGFVDLTPLSLPGRLPNLMGITHMYLKKKVNDKRQNELIPYNDCLYRNMYMYKYIVLLDTDEIIMPLTRSTWMELMDLDVLPKAARDKKKAPVASYNVRNVYFLDDATSHRDGLDDIPEYLHMSRHIYRAENYTKPGQYVKSFHNPERVLNLHNHFPLHCLERACRSYAIELEDAQLQHYRADCVSTLKKSCEKVYRNHTVMDTTIWRYRKPLLQNVQCALADLGDIPRSECITDSS